MSNSVNLKNIKLKKVFAKVKGVPIYSAVTPYLFERVHHKIHLNKSCRPSVSPFSWKIPRKTIYTCRALPLPNQSLLFKHMKSFNPLLQN